MEVPINNYYKLLYLSSVEGGADLERPLLRTRLPKEVHQVHEDGAAAARRADQVYDPELLHR